jgi:hypothetical protein
MGPKGADGATGPKGDTGDTGVAGPQGPSGVSGYTRVAKRQQFAPRDGVRVVVDCPDGTEALGGGYSIGGQFEPIEVKESYPTPRTMPGNGWTVTAFNHDFLFVGAVTVYAMCADVTSP